MGLFALGINHQTAPVALRERLAFGDDVLPDALHSLRALPSVREAALLSTCNRTELYAVADDEQVLKQWLADYSADGNFYSHDSLEAYLYQYQDNDAARHLFRVATGLDSLVLGEPQILGQVKHAWSKAREFGSLGGMLDRLFQQSFVTAKRARTETRIGTSPVSVASIAVRLAQQTFARPDDATVLLIGAGETIELTARHLAQANVKQLLIANRTYAHAQELAARHNAVALPLEELERHLFLADIVFSATASRLPVVSRAQVEHALSLRKRRPMLLMDLAVPRDIEPSVADLDNAFLYTVDDLERVSQHNRQDRLEAADAAESIIELQVSRYAETLATIRHNEPIKQLRSHAEVIKEDVISKAKHQLSIGHNPHEVVELLAHALTNRLLHAPTSALRDAAARGDIDLIRAFSKLLPENKSSGER